MNYKEAINASQIWAARGFDPKSKECVVSIAYYGGKLLWLTGWGGDWKKEWEAIPEDDIHKLNGLDFRPTGPRPEDQINDEMLDALTEIAEEYEIQEEDADNYIEPMGEIYD